MESVGKLLVVVGLVSVVIGAIVWSLGRAGFRGLPGDIYYQSPSGGLRIVFPIVTSIVVSILITAGLWLWRWLAGR